MTRPTMPALTDNPIAAVQAWLKQAEQTEPADANAAALATATANGIPSVRMVLVKSITDNGFVFYTNGDSRKGGELQQNPHAALCFYWKSLACQVRVEGRCTPLPATQSDAYFASRDRESQLASAASKQSQPLASPDDYAKAIDALAMQLGQAPVPRPQAWQGYRIIPVAIELWRAGKARRHTRIRYTRTDAGWQSTYLYP